MAINNIIHIIRVKIPQYIVAFVQRRYVKEGYVNDGYVN
jgi:hypothetical protein